MNIKRRTFLKFVPVSLLAMFIPAIFLKQEGQDKTIKEIIDNREKAPVQIFTSNNSKNIAASEYMMVIEVPMEYVVCNLGDKVYVSKDCGQVMGWTQYLPFTGLVRRIEPTCALSSQIVIVKLIYAEKRTAVINGKIVEVYA